MANAKQRNEAKAQLSGFSRCEHFLNTVKNGYKKAKLLNDQEQTFSMTTKLENTSLSGHARIARK